MINKNTRILKYIFRNPEIEDFIRGVYNLRYENQEISDKEVLDLKFGQRFGNLNINSIRTDVKKETERAIRDVGEKIDLILDSVFPRKINQLENFTRSYVLKIFSNDELKEKIVYPISSSKEIEQIVRMDLTGFLRHIKREDLLSGNCTFSKPHVSYKPNPDAENNYVIRNVQARIKTPESLANKVIRYFTNPEKEGGYILDFSGIRLILDKDSDEKDCYRVDKLINELFNDHERVTREDYIANPKPDTGFQSIKNVFTDGSCFEIQIRSYNMHMNALDDNYSETKFQNGKSGCFYLLLEDLFSARYD